MNKVILGLFIFFGIFNVAHGANNIYSNTFETFNLGNLTGQDSWTGAQSYQVSNTGESFKYITATTTGKSNTRAITTVAGETDLYLSFEYYYTGLGANFSGAGGITVNRCTNLACSSTAGVDLLNLFKRTGALHLEDATDATLATPVAGTWNYFEINYKISTGVVRYRTTPGGAWTTQARTITFTNTFGMQLVISGPSSSAYTVRWDDFGQTEFVNNSYLRFLNPLDGGSTSTTTIGFQFEYYLNTDQYEEEPNNQILLQLYPRGYPQASPQRVTVTTNVIPNSRQVVYATTTTAYKGYYLGMVNFWNGVSENIDCSWYNIFCDEETINIGIGQSINFNVATTTIDLIPGLEFESLSSLCDDGLFLGGEAICKVMMYLFQPSEQAVQNFLGIQNNLRNKTPFNYYYETQDKLVAMLEMEGEVGEDVVLDMHGSFIEGDVTIFSWTSAKTTLDAMIPSEARMYIVYGEWIIFGILALWLVIKFI